MPPYIDLQRRFRDMTAAELEDSEFLASLNERTYGSEVGWSELLKHSRVILLAEAGAGKTIEMVEQTKRLVREGKFAFFVALESLDREPLGNVLSTAEEATFEAWKADRQASAWFFLDAVDELKLTEGKLDRALLRLSKAIDNHLDRVHIIISCRPTDWRSSFDSVTVTNRLPVSPKREGASRSSDEVFIDALRRDQGVTVKSADEESKAANNDVLRTVILLPMSDRQIELFAEKSGVDDAVSFLAEVRLQNAWTFARRPFDLTELIATWSSSGCLGTRALQHESNIIAKLKDEPDRPDHGMLTDAKARLGAERLALALALTRSRTIRSPDQVLAIQRAKGVLDPATILPDWTEQERQALLRRALFDPATYGRVRFHHRSVQEFLAARRLQELREKGMSTKTVFRLLFAEHYGVDVVFPSMRAVAAWLALYDDPVRRELTIREPEALLSLGDPESLSFAARTELLRGFVSAYGHGGWRGLNIPIDEVRRLAHPELGPVIRELWGAGPTNTDVRELLIEMIWQGPIESCADLVETAARDMAWGEYHRVAAIRALLACRRTEIARELADSMMTHPEFWPDKVMLGVAADLFPKIISVDELVTVIERCYESDRTVHDFNWVLCQIVEAIEPCSELMVALRDQVTALVWRGREAKQEFYRIRSKFGYLTPALMTLCEKQLTAGSREADVALIYACVIASRFSEDESGIHETIAKLKVHFDADVVLREQVFWAELDFMDRIIPVNDEWNRFYNVERHSLLGYLAEVDRPWLMTALASESRPDRRPVALHSLIKLWYQKGRVASELDVLRKSLNGDAALEAILTEGTTPPVQSESIEKRERRNRRRQCVQTGREAQRLQNWKNWRDEMLADPIGAFLPEKQATTVGNLYTWLSGLDRKTHRYNVWNKEALAQAFGEDIANHAEKAFRAKWRAVRPELWSSRPVEKRNSMPYAWRLGLCGLAAEFSAPRTTGRLTPDDARTAAIYATVELNGFASFITELAQTHPVEVDAVLGSELSAQLSVGADNEHLPILQDLTYADNVLKRLLAPRLAAALLAWPSTFSDEMSSRWAHHLDQVLRVLSEPHNEVDRRIIVQECSNRYETNPTGPLASVWIKGVFQFDARKGTQVLTASLAIEKNSCARDRAIEIFAGLFGDRDAIIFEIADASQRARTLGDLVRTAYIYIREEDDRKHDGVYSPDTRDMAETARNFLLSALLDTPGPEARCVTLELAAEPDFARFPDRLRLLARQRTASDAEFDPYTSDAIVALETRYEMPPHDRDGLFTVMLDRLDDLAHDISHHDFTDRRTLRRITDEVEMQRTLSLRIEAKARGAFVVTREDEVADLKRTDIRLSSVTGEQKAAIEVKLADKRWSLTDLERALRSQLDGQYLRHVNCRAGCLLLTYDGRKKFWQHPETRTRLNFQAMVAYLNEKARALEIEKMHSVRIAVVGLDLTDPLLAPAHRN